MNKFFDTIVWGFLLLFAVPSVMIVASWNALPGDPLFGMKRGLEQTLLFAASPSYAARGTLQVKYTERRFSEAKQLLAAKASVEGLVYLNDQVATTTKTVTQAPNAKAQKELAQAYIATLQTVAIQLEQQRQVAAASPASPSQAAVRTSSGTVVTRQDRTVTVTTPGGTTPHQPSGGGSAPAASAAVVVAEIAHTEEKIKETIKEMEKVAKEAEQEEHKQEQEEKREEKKEEHDDEGRGQEENKGKGNDDKDD